MLSHVRLFGTSWTVAPQVPLSTEFSRKEYWSGQPIPSPGGFSNPGIEPGSPALQADSLPAELSAVPKHPWCSVFTTYSFYHNILAKHLRFINKKETKKVNQWYNRLKVNILNLDWMGSGRRDQDQPWLKKWKQQLLRMGTNYWFYYVCSSSTIPKETDRTEGKSFTISFRKK